MFVLGLIRTRNDESSLESLLSNMESYCDSVFALDDRSTDRTREILSRHRLVDNVFHAPMIDVEECWIHPEWEMIELLYRMADLANPDWVIMLDSDEILTPPDAVRPALAALPREVTAVYTIKESVWEDETYPEMVPLMGSASGWRCDIWRHRRGATSTRKRLHSGKLPIEADSNPTRSHGFRCQHNGWNTLARRIDRVRLYSSLDPTYEMNDGLSYGKGLLFGYELDQVEQLIADYRARESGLSRDAGG